MAEKVKVQKAKLRQNLNGHTSNGAPEQDAWLSEPQSPVEVPPKDTDQVSVNEDKGKEKVDAVTPKFRGIPEDVKLFEVFWHQVVELIKVSSLAF